MPNWCQNVLTVTGTLSELIRFKYDLIKGTGVEGDLAEAFSFATFVPVPADVLTGPCGGGTFVRTPEGWQDVPSFVKGSKYEEEFLELEGEDARALLRQNGHEVERLSFGTAADGTIVNLNDPEELRGRLTWYKWNCQHWGSKWDACDTRIMVDEADRLTLEFDTAWSPPVPVVETMLEQYPELDFELSYVEEGMGFAGGISRDGEWSEDIDDLETCVAT